MKKILINIILLCMAFPIFANDNLNKPRFEAELDPIAYILNGFSIHGIIVMDRIRTDIGIFGIKQPEGFNGNSGFQVKTKGIGLKINYLFDAKETWFGGLGVGYSANQINLINTNENQNQDIIGVGLHIGYRWFMFNNSSSFLKNIYISPWVSVDYNFPINNITFQSKSYTQNSITFFPTVHIGYKF